MRVFLPVYFFAASILVFVLRVYLVRRRIGINPIAEKWRDDVRGYVARWLVVLELLVGLNIVLFALDGQAYQYLLPFDGLTHGALQIAAVGLLVVALIWVIVAQIQMGDSWRIGIDPDATTELVSHGIFGISRNPIYLGMRVLLLGLFLACPNVLSLLVVIVGDLLMQVQVRVEEQYLESVHAQAFLHYKRSVPRWLIKLPAAG